MRATTLTGRLVATARRFGSDDRGSAVIDMLPVFFALVIIVLMIFEIGIGFYLNLASQKAAQLGARSAIVHDPVHADVPDENQLFYANGSYGDACYQEGKPDACLDPGGPWVCDGASLGGACNQATFDAIIQDMRRADPNLDPARVTISYIYRRLGYAGGPFVPEVRVDLALGRYGFLAYVLGDGFESTVFSPEDTANPHEKLKLGRASASAFGEDLNSTN